MGEHWMQIYQEGLVDFCIYFDLLTSRITSFCKSAQWYLPWSEKKCISISLQIKCYFLGFENLNLYTLTLGLIKITGRGMKKNLYIAFSFTQQWTKARKYRRLFTFLPCQWEISSISFILCLHEANQMPLAAEATGGGSWQWPLIMELPSMILPFPRALCEEIVHFATLCRLLSKKAPSWGLQIRRQGTTSLLQSLSSKNDATLTV